MSAPLSMREVEEYFRTGHWPSRRLQSIGPQEQPIMKRLTKVISHDSKQTFIHLALDEDFLYVTVAAYGQNTQEMSFPIHIFESLMDAYQEIAPVVTRTTGG